jgi:hypothetical protein
MIIKRTGGVVVWNIQEQILSAASSLNINIEKVEAIEVERMISKVIDKFAGGSKSMPLWEHLKDDLSVNSKDAWLWLGELIGDVETIMFFNPTDEKEAFCFNKGDDVVSVLGETYGFEFYLTNRDLEYLICFNHHDVLIVCGNAIKKLKNINYENIIHSYKGK